MSPTKQLDLRKTKEQLFNQVPGPLMSTSVMMIDTILALNYSSSTMRTYTVRFKVLRDHQFRDPHSISQKKLLNTSPLMERGLSASGHSMVNALLFYYPTNRTSKGFELKYDQNSRRNSPSVDYGRMFVHFLGSRQPKTSCYYWLWSRIGEW
jgi:hypothetical protein